MADLSRFRSLSEEEQTLVAIGVLLDGAEAVSVFEADRDRSLALVRATKDVLAINAELRVAMLGTILRELTHKE